MANIPEASTSQPGLRKAHSNAAARRFWRQAEPRTAGLIQTAWRQNRRAAKAVLEQPSPRRVPSNFLGRRNIVLSQSDELNTIGNKNKVPRRKR
ncbi:hypothetical protein VT84_30065 [Gemmata sp. SH-PL17]|uniref:hypothetical protein n=1 Tax=Gemmata sp. SH-PL17 TaxID=1630693 RepID=UPI00078C65F5|nr:hypothetical protein [Gemmata sp. SH-PL17]AMV28689.1 hypothetical protein VT84_30065 [Gemmata sp. SH-PL17]